MVFSKGVTLMGTLSEADTWPGDASLDALLASLGTSRAGLASGEAALRLASGGPNALPRAVPTPLWRIVGRQLANPLVLILSAAAAVSLAFGDAHDAAFIAVAIAIDAAIGAWQEQQAEYTSRAMEKLLSIRAAVVRDGRLREVSAEELVPGDLVWIESGNRIPADARLLSSTGLQVDESLLTGESLPVAKETCGADGAGEGPGESGFGRRDAVLAGSIVTSGRGTAVITATGMATAVGKLALDISSRPAAQPPLVARMERFVRVIALAVVSIAIGIGTLGVVMGGYGLREMFALATALVVSTIPEGLPVSITIVLAIAVARMAKRGVIVRRLPAVEGLGSCTLIATDKTGTLTCNELTVVAAEVHHPPTLHRPPEVFTVSGQGFAPLGAVFRGKAAEAGAPVRLSPLLPEDARLQSLALCGVLCNEATLHQHDGMWSWRGDAVDVALLSFGMKLGLSRDAELEACPLCGAVPFEPEHRFAATFHTMAGGSDPGTAMVCIKGAPEAVLPMCGDGSVLAEWEQNAAALAADGLRVLALARGWAGSGATGVGGVHRLLSTVETVEFLGFLALVDPLRPGVREAVRRCHGAGIEVVMITGDHRQTALAIAKQLDITQDACEVIDGTELALVAPADLVEIVRARRVFARVTPNQKLQIVEAAQRAGHFVAVTGDGANDAPALRAANIGVAMGKSGTDIAREAAGLVISDDTFSTIVVGVEEGRIAYDNVRKVIFLLISTGLAELVLVILSVATRSPLPLTAAQLLWLNLITNGIQDVALACEPGQGDELSRPPRPAGEPVFDRTMTERTLLAGVVMGSVAFAVFQLWLGGETWAGAGGHDRLAAARNATLLLMVFFENIHIGNCRSETRSLFTLSPLRSPFLLGAVALALTVHIVAMHLPATQAVLGTAPLAPAAWLGLLLTALVIIPPLEILKWLERRRRQGG